VEVLEITYPSSLEDDVKGAQYYTQA